MLAVERKVEGSEEIAEVDVLCLAPRRRGSSLLTTSPAQMVEDAGTLCCEISLLPFPIAAANLYFRFALACRQWVGVPSVALYAKSKNRKRLMSVPDNLEDMVGFIDIATGRL